MRNILPLIENIFNFKPNEDAEISIFPGQTIINTGDYNITIYPRKSKKHTGTFQPNQAFIAKQIYKESSQYDLKILAGINGGQITIINGEFVIGNSDFDLISARLTDIVDKGRYVGYDVFYQTLNSYTFTNSGYVRYITALSDTFGDTYFKLTLAGTVVFINAEFLTMLNLDWSGMNGGKGRKFEAGDTILLEVYPPGGSTITVDGLIEGMELV